MFATTVGILFGILVGLLVLLVFMMHRKVARVRAERERNTLSRPVYIKRKIPE